MQTLPQAAATLPTPRFAFATFPILHTPRLLLRALSHEDGDAVFAFRGDSEVQRYNSEPLREAQEARHFIESRALDFKARRALLWGVTRRGDTQVIGSVSLFHWNHHDHHVEIGYELARAWWGRGLAAEAVGAAVHFAFEHMQVHRIEAMTIADNQRSVRLLEQLGFCREGTRREFSLENDGVYHDSALYGLLARERRGSGAGEPA